MFLGADMFTGLIRDIGVLKKSFIDKNLLILDVENEHLSAVSKVKDSITVNGICLTISEINKAKLRFELVEETQNRTTALSWKENQLLHLEPAMRLTDRLDGHLVSGHIDTTLPLKERIVHDDALELIFELPNEFTGLVIEKGSVAIDGVSLTIASLETKSDAQEVFSVWLIPTTLENTNLGSIKIGDRVNIEFDQMGKYVKKNIQRISLEN